MLRSIVGNEETFTEFDAGALTKLASWLNINGIRGTGHPEDAARLHPRPDECQRHQAFADLMIPVVKGELNAPVRCGGVVVKPLDVIVGDEEGIVVIPSAALDCTLQAAGRKIAMESAQSLNAWEAEHRIRIDKFLRDKGFFN